MSSSDYLIELRELNLELNLGLSVKESIEASDTEDLEEVAVDLIAFAEQQEGSPTFPEDAASAAVSYPRKRQKLLLSEEFGFALLRGH